jgi:hypothetical protein
MAGGGDGGQPLDLLGSESSLPNGRQQAGAPFERPAAIPGVSLDCLTERTTDSARYSLN